MSTSRSVSVTEATHAAMRRYADEHGVTLASIVEDATADIGHAGDDDAAITLSAETYERVVAHARKQGLTPSEAIEAAVAKMTGRVP